MWETVRLGDVASVTAGQSPKGDTYNRIGDGVPFYQGKKDYGPRFLNPPQVWTTSPKKFAEKDDIIISVRAPVGALNVATQKVCIGRGLAAIRGSGRLLNDYLFYVLLNISVNLEGTSGAIFNSINKKQIEDISLPLPPLAEQKRIVKRLDKAFAEIDKAIATAEAKEGEVERLKAATLSAMLNRGAHSGTSITDDEEDSVMWETVKLGEVCTVKTGKKDVNEGNPEGAYPFFTCAKDNTYSDTYSFDCEAILIAGNGAVGQTSYYEGKFEAYQRTYVLTEFTRILPKFLLFILQGRLIQSMSSMVLGNTIPYIKKGMLMDFRLPLPPLAEQKRIAERLDKAFAEIEIIDGKTQSCVENYSALKASILRQELTLSEAV